MVAASSLRFDLPDGCRTFTPFPRLPPELRQQIWRATVSTPGMQFVKLESRGRSWRWVSMDRPFHSVHHLAHLTPSDGAANENDDEITVEVRHEVAPKKMWDTRIVPLAPTKESDISCYHSLNRQLATLSLTCSEARDTARSLKSKKDLLRLSDGTIFSLANSADVVFLEYFPPELYETGCSFGIDPNCPGLDRIRRVAVRYSHQWEQKAVPSICSMCGLVHDSPSSVVYPVHLYQFLARHLPNLEEFYFLDYFLLRLPKDETRNRSDEDVQGKDGVAEEEQQTEECSPLTLRCGNRTFYEANPKEWDIKPEIQRMKAWLESRFVRYAETSPLSRHTNPKKVRFSILACEWDIAPPVSLRRQPTTPTPKGGNKRMLYENNALRHGRRRVLRRAESYDANEVEPIKIEADVPIVFGNGDLTSFAFTFAVPLK